MKRAVIKEELVALLGNAIDAIILNQFLYWSERVSDVDEYLQQEIKRSESMGEELQGAEDLLTDGWIYKSADELSDETMLGLSRGNMRKHIKKLVDLGYLLERRNPTQKWDRTFQYRVNTVRIQNDLSKLGYFLEGYSAPSKNPSRCNGTDLSSNETEHYATNRCIKGAESSLQSDSNVATIPEITTEITTKITTENTKKMSDDIFCVSDETPVDKPAREKVDYQRIIEAWNSLPDPVPKIRGMEEARKMSVRARLRTCGGVDGMIKVIESIKSQPFLLGERTDFIIKFDWFIGPKNFTKVMEGNYADRGAQAKAHPKIETRGDRVRQQTERNLEALKEWGRQNGIV